MKRKSWHIDRRTLLKGAGVTLALPLLNSMLWGKEESNFTPKKRFCGVYFPFGVPMPSKGSTHAEWNWYPEVNGSEYRFREIMKPFESLKKDITIFKNVTHFKNPGAHDSGDAFLTGVRDSVSVDQILAEKYGHETRLASLSLSTDGGIGVRGRSNTLSYSSKGVPIPTENNLRRIFDRMFSVETQKKQIITLKKSKSILDVVMESSKSLKSKVGKQDQAKLDEYLTSIRQLEMRIQKEEQWLSKPLPNIDSKKIALDVTYKDANDYLKSMYDLIFLSLQTDTTRYATYQIANQQNSGQKGGDLPIHVGLGLGHQHSLSHAMNKDDGPKKYGQYLQILNTHYAYFLKRLQSAQEGSSNILDNTIVVYGSSNGNPTHSSVQYPVVVAGGSGLGLKQGQYINFEKRQALSNVFLTILNRVDSGHKSFAESSGEVSQMLRV